MAQQMVYHSILKRMCFAELLGVVLYKYQLMIKVVDSVQITSAFIYHCLILLKSPIIIIELSVSHLTSVPTSFLFTQGCFMFGRASVCGT